MKTPTIQFRPLKKSVFADVQRHVREVRRLFDWPGIPYHDVGEHVDNRFNRWYWHNLPVLRAIHNDPEFIRMACKIFGTPVQPSYVFLSMYGPEGVCPPHTDRPQCPYTIDLAINQDGTWPIYIGADQNTPDDECRAYLLEPGEAVAYSGVYHRHFRNSMCADSRAYSQPGNSEALIRPATYTDLAFFHFVDTNWQGKVD